MFQLPPSLTSRKTTPVQPSELAAAFSFAAVNAVVLLVSGSKILPPLVFQKLTGNVTFMIGEMVVYVFIDVDGQSRGNKNILFNRPEISSKNFHLSIMTSINHIEYFWCSHDGMFYINKWHQP